MTKAKPEEAFALAFDYGAHHEPHDVRLRGRFRVPNPLTAAGTKAPS